MKVTSSKKRMCIITRDKLELKELIRITNVNGIWQINDLPYQGRSFYLRKDKEIIQKFLKRKKINLKNFTLNEPLKEELLKYAQNL